MKRRIKKNIYGNWVGYEGARRTMNFGTQDIASAYWYFTGIYDPLEGYSEEWFQKCKEFCFSL